MAGRVVRPVGLYRRKDRSLTPTKSRAVVRRNEQGRGLHLLLVQISKSKPCVGTLNNSACTTKNYFTFRLNRNKSFLMSDRAAKTNVATKHVPLF